MKSCNCYCALFTLFTARNNDELACVEKENARVLMSGCCYYSKLLVFPRWCWLASDVRKYFWVDSNRPIRFVLLLSLYRLARHTSLTCLHLFVNIFKERTFDASRKCAVECIQFKDKYNFCIAVALRQSRRNCIFLIILQLMLCSDECAFYLPCHSKFSRRYYSLWHQN